MRAAFRIGAVDSSNWRREDRSAGQGPHCWEIPPLLSLKIYLVACSASSYARHPQLCFPTRKIDRDRWIFCLLETTLLVSFFRQSGALLARLLLNDDRSRPVIYKDSCRYYYWLFCFLGTTYPLCFSCLPETIGDS